MEKNATADQCSANYQADMCVWKTDRTFLRIICSLGWKALFTFTIQLKAPLRALLSKSVRIPCDAA